MYADYPRSSESLKSKAFFSFSGVFLLIEERDADRRFILFVVLVWCWESRGSFSLNEDSYVSCSSRLRILKDTWDEQQDSVLL